jgi:hypothetical protein
MNDERAENMSFHVGIMEPKDAPGLVELFRAVYGDNYPIREMYDPEYLLAHQERRAMYHIIARDPKGKVAGHLALFHASAPFAGIWELGHGMVLPECRNLNLNRTMAEYAHLKLVPELGIEQVWGEAVTNHIYMQKTILHLGAGGYEKERDVAGRVSAVLTFTTLKAKAQRLFLPGVYDEVIRQIYRSAPVDFGHTYLEADGSARAEGPSSLRSNLVEAAGVCRVVLLRIGADIRERMAQTEQEMIEQGAVVFQVFVRLTDPLAGVAVEALRARGYFFGGVLPRWFDDDGVLLQKVVEEPNFKGIQLYSEVAARLLEFIRADRDEASRQMSPGN